MCTVLVLLRPGERWPLLLASNRDERLDRAFDPPGRWWPDAPDVVGWRDATAGGSWLAVNDGGTVATVVNGVHELGPAPGKASRGELVVGLLAASERVTTIAARRDATVPATGDARGVARAGPRDARGVAEAARALDPGRYRGFALLVADRRSAFVATNDGRRVAVRELTPGHHMLTPEGIDVHGAPRVEACFDAFRAAPPPAPERGDWSAWVELLRREDREDPHRAMTVVTGSGFGTVASTLVAIPAAQRAPVLLFAPGPPTRTPFERCLPDRFPSPTSKAPQA